MNERLVSIIVAIYNVEKYLCICLDSLVNQSYKNIEIILIDDGSSDKSGQICDNYANVYDNIKVYHQSNSGVSIARNYGISKANGEYICFVDSDDFVSTNYIEVLINTTSKNKIDMPICGYVSSCDESDFRDNKSNSNIKVVEAKYMFDHMLNHEEFESYLWNKLFNKKIIDKYHIRFPEGILVWEDMYFVLTYLKHIKKVGIIEESIYFYRIRENSATQEVSYDKLDSMVKVCEMFTYLDDNNNSFYSKCSNALLFSNLIRCSYFGVKYKKITNEHLKSNLNKAINLVKYINPNIKDYIRLIILKLVSLFY